MRTPPFRPFVCVAFALLAGALDACSAAVGPGTTTSDGSTVSDATSDATSDAPAVDSAVTYCDLPSGGRCAAGTTCPAGDGCNVCACQPDGMLACTERDCPVMDAGGVQCTSSRDCAALAGYECVFDFGCPDNRVPQGTCRPAIACDDPGALCGCDGTTYYACQPNRPTNHATACEGPAVDAGTSCVGAFLGRGGECTGPADNSLPASCCSGQYSCARRDVGCARDEPVCPAGELPSVWMSCWGPCVPAAYCAPIPCDPASANDCPSGYVCDPAARVCRATG